MAPSTCPSPATERTPGDGSGRQLEKSGRQANRAEPRAGKSLRNTRGASVSCQAASSSICVASAPRAPATRTAATTGTTTTPSPRTLEAAPSPSGSTPPPTTPHAGSTGPRTYGPSHPRPRLPEADPTAQRRRVHQPRPRGHRVPAPGPQHRPRPPAREPPWLRDHRQLPRPAPPPATTHRRPPRRGLTRSRRSPPRSSRAPRTPPAAANR